MANFIAVTCEYDISGSFGGNNNQEVFEIRNELSSNEIDTILKEKYEYLISEIGEDGTWEEFVSWGLFTWDYIDIRKL